MKWVVLILLSLFVSLQYSLWMKDGGVADVKRLKKDVELQTLSATMLRLRNQQLEAEVHDLKYRLEAIEEVARTDLGMIKKGETFYQYLE